MDGRGAQWKQVSKPRGLVYLTGSSLFFRLCIENKDAGAAPDVAAEVLGRDEAESVAAKPGANLIRGSRHCCRMASLSQHAGDNQCSYGLPDAS